MPDKQPGKQENNEPRGRAAPRGSRQVHAPGSGRVRPGASAPQVPRTPPPAPEKPKAPDEIERRTQEFRDTYGFDPPKEFTSSWQAAHDAARRERANPAPQAGAAEGNVYRRPGQAQQPPRRPAMTEAQARAAARRAREQRRARRRLAVVGTVACVLILAAVVTMLIPKGTTRLEAGMATSEAASGLQQSVVAPLPYAGAAGGSGETLQTADWGVVGPVRQADSYTYTATPESTGALVPEFGRVDTSWFADAAFLGDSLTAGLTVYDIDVGGALVCGYEGTSPNKIAQRAVLTHDERGEEIPLDVLAEKQPAKLYVLLGTNALVGLGNDEGFMEYYGLMLDALKETLPGTAIFVQSVLPARPEVLDKLPGLAPDRIAGINASIRQLCVEKGMYYLNLDEKLCGEDGYLREDIANTDGVHLTVQGYTEWVDYLCTHVPYNKNNPYQAGSTYYLTDEVKELLADLP